MRVCKGLFGLAVVVLITGGTLFADDTTNTNNQPLTPQTPPEKNEPVEPAPSPQPSNPEASAPESNPPSVATPENAPSQGALMQGLDKIGIGHGLENLGLSIGGHVEAGFLHDFSVSNSLNLPKSAPADDILFAGPYKNDFDLNQLDLAVERHIDPSKGNFDVGFKIEGMFGRDAFYTHSNGVLDQSNKNFGASGPQNQFDLLQAYVDFAIPVGTGLSVEAGKFVSLLGYESIDPTQNLFYTHSYEFAFGTPFTQTGVLGKYTFQDSTTSGSSTTLTAGITRGWNQSLYDNNGSPDGVLQINSITAGGLAITGTLVFGPEGVLPYGPSNTSDWWFTPEATLSYKASDQLTLAADFLYSDAVHLSQWIDAALYAHYQLDPHLALNARAEFYHDQRGITTGVGGSDVNYTALTLGVAVTPMPDSSLFQTLTIRPEIRGDWADEAVLNYSHFSEYTGAVDLYWKF